MSNVFDLFLKCNYCKRDLLDDMRFLKHEKYGIVCERCEPFEDGGISIVEELDNDE